jgi:hypothetical protein
MNPSRPGNDAFPNHSFVPFDEGAIRQRTDRVGKQVGEAVSSLLAEIILSIVMSRSQMVFRHPPMLVLRPFPFRPRDRIVY